MAKGITGAERRQQIISLLKFEKKPVSGTKIGEIMGVSRQIVVQDMALLRSNGVDIISTSKGYYIQNPDTITRIIKVHHTNEQAEDELKTIIDAGGIVVNVIVNHRVYGKVKAELNIRNRRDIVKFMEEIKTGKSSLLSNVTSGYHFHTIEADSEEVMDDIERELEKKKYLAKVFSYENMDE